MANKVAVKSNNTAVGILKSITIAVKEGEILHASSALISTTSICVSVNNLVLFQCVDVKVLWCHEKDAG